MHVAMLGSRKIHSIKNCGYGFVLFLFCILTFSSPISALSNTQLREFQSGVLFFDEEGSYRYGETCVAGSTSGGEVPTNFNLGNEGKERRVNLVGYLVADYGLAPHQAAGIVGNFMVESAATLTAAEKVPPDVNQGDTEGSPPDMSNGLGYGWAQWSGVRKKVFIEFAVENGYMESQSVNGTDSANYAYLRYEIDNEERFKELIPELKKQDTPEDAAEVFEDIYEGAGVPALTRRKSQARKVFEEFTESGRGSGETSTSCIGIVGDIAFPLVGDKSVVNNPEIFRDGDTAQAGHPYTAYDILADPGVNVVALAAGTVVSHGGSTCDSDGSVTVYDASQDRIYWYAHMEEADRVPVGTEVQAGDHIGVINDPPAGQGGCSIPHLHIDSMEGDRRLACSRNSCPSSTAEKFIPIGPELYTTYQALPDSRE